MEIISGCLICQYVMPCGFVGRTGQAEIEVKVEIQIEDENSPPKSSKSTKWNWNEETKIQTYNSRSLNFRFIRRLIGNIPRRSNEREISGQSNMKHNIFRCIEKNGQIWEGCAAFKKALALAVATNDTWVEGSYQIKSNRNKLSKSAFTQFQSFIIADGPEKSWNYHQIAKLAIWHHQLALTMLLQHSGCDYNDVRHSKAKVWYIDLMNQLQGKLKTNLFPVAKNFFPLFFRLVQTLISVRLRSLVSFN